MRTANTLGSGHEGAVAGPPDVPAESPELRLVKGPSALGGGWRRFRDLLVLITLTEFRRTYFDTALGYVWSLARPLLLFGILLAVFTHVFRIGSQVPNYPVLLLLNLVLMTFFSEATGSAVPSLVNNEGIVRKTQFPRLVIPLSVVTTAGINLSFNLLAVLIFMLAWKITPATSWLLFPCALAYLMIQTSAVSVLLSSLYPRFRDVGIIWSVISTALFYGTPVLYPLEVVPVPLRDVIIVNPLTPVFVYSRSWLIDPNAPTLADLASHPLLPVVPYLIGALLVVAAALVFKREAPRIAEEL